jgi:RNA ligase (TIGR02306 family)
MRKLVTIRRIDDIYPIPDADKIECAVIGGWKVVVKKGEFKVNDLALYFEIDSFIPTKVAPFLTAPANKPRLYKDCFGNEIEGERLRTVKLKGQLSQGLLLPLEQFPQFSDKKEGDNVTEELGVVLYELFDKFTNSEMLGEKPTEFPSTEVERLQNVNLDKHRNKVFEVTEKVEGRSSTYYLSPFKSDDENFIVCSKSVMLKRNEQNALWDLAIKNDLERKMKEYGLTGIAIQGELIGKGIKGALTNYYQLNFHDFYVFNIYDSVKGKYLTPDERYKLVDKLGLKHVKVLGELTIGDKTMDELLQFANGFSHINSEKLREGVVLKHNDLKIKIISNEFLLKNKI